MFKILILDIRVLKRTNKSNNTYKMHQRSIKSEKLTTASRKLWIFHHQINIWCKIFAFSEQKCE